MSYQRGYVGGNFALEIDGIAAGWLTAAEGGLPSSEVIVEKLGPDHLLHKHVSGIHFEDIALTFGTAMSRVFLERVKDSFERRDYTRFSGAVVSADYGFREKRRLEFRDALVSELTFPALDAGSRDTCACVLKLAPEYARVSGGSNVDDARDDSHIRDAKDQAKQHRWSPANFRLRIDNLDCSRVYKIDSLTLRQKLVDYAIGEERGVQKEPVQVEYPDLAVTVPESHAGTWTDWFQSFVTDGRCDEGQERTGTLEYLDPSLGKTLLSLDFHGLGVYKAVPDGYVAGSETIRRVKFQMYCERITFAYGRGSTFGGGR